MIAKIQHVLPKRGKVVVSGAEAVGRRVYKLSLRQIVAGGSKVWQVRELSDGEKSEMSISGHKPRREHHHYQVRKCLPCDVPVLIR